MKQEILLKQKIGMRLSRTGALSKVFATQAFTKDKRNITPEQYTVLSVLKENDGMYMRQIANLTFKDRPNMTRIAAILEGNGYITSTLEAEGRQVKKLYITEKGKEVCKQTIPTILEVWDNTISGLSEDEVESFLQILDKIDNNLRNNTILQS